MDFRYANVIKTFQTIKDFKPEGDPSLSTDALLESPASLINDCTLQQFDDEIAAAVIHADIRKETVTDYDDYNEEDFIDPNALKEAELSEDILSEIELKFDDIIKTLNNILSSMDLRLYADNRPVFKKSLYNDIFRKYFSEYEYITHDIRIRLSSIISAETDKAFKALSAPSKQRAANLFSRLLQSAGSYIDTCLADTKNKSDKLASALYKAVVKQYINPARQSCHYTPSEYTTICKMMKNYINKKCK